MSCNNAQERLLKIVIAVQLVLFFGTLSVCALTSLCLRTLTSSILVQRRYYLHIPSRG